MYVCMYVYICIYMRSIGGHVTRAAAASALRPRVRARPRCEALPCSGAVANGCDGVVGCAAS